ncbi:MarR family winged helix-turn-helix transcriptional regulator [Enterococcus sp. LJL120]
MLNDCINFLMNVSQHKVFKHYSKLLIKSEVTPAQAGILTCIWEQDKTTPKEIGQKLFLEAPTVSGLLDKMQKQGLISRTTDELNRRIVFVEATEKANQLKETIQAATAKMNREVLQNFSETDQKVLKQLLLKFINTDLT